LHSSGRKLVANVFFCGNKQEASTFRITEAPLFCLFEREIDAEEAVALLIHVSVKNFK
tara:strand:+ start:195 stop:368 length:174 start_codon:yes stop_codon:yes gene_type:complete